MQKVVSIKEARTYMREGWRWLTHIPPNEAIIEAPRQPAIAKMSCMKEFAKKWSPPDSEFRLAIMQEPDEMPLEEYIAKIEVYMKIFDLEMNALERYWRGRPLPSRR